MQELAYINEGPGLGGQLKQSPQHFVVEEIPLYEASGHGPHLYLSLRRKGLTTRQVVELLAKLFKLSSGDIGYAGLKDKNALTTQFFSLPLDVQLDAEVPKILQDTPLELLLQGRHQNKLKVGHLIGNRFTLILTEAHGSLEEALALAEILKEKGVPNYFGPQRFGHDGDNFEIGLKILKAGKKARSFQDKFLLSSLQAFIYNHYLTARVRQNIFDKIILGDICKKYQTGGLFVSEDDAVESSRLANGEITHTGPIFGQKMKLCQHAAYDFEMAALSCLGISFEDMKNAGVGDRRPNRLLLHDLKVDTTPQSGELKFTFSLPKGAYATTVMREFIKE